MGLSDLDRLLYDFREEVRELVRELRMERAIRSMLERRLEQLELEKTQWSTAIESLFNG